MSNEDLKNIRIVEMETHQEHSLPNGEGPRNEPHDIQLTQ
jgi:hypothetical protein